MRSSSSGERGPAAGAEDARDRFSAGAEDRLLLRTLLSFRAAVWMRERGPSFLLTQTYYTGTESRQSGEPGSKSTPAAMKDPSGALTTVERMRPSPRKRFFLFS